MQTDKRFTSNPLFWIAVAVAAIGIAAIAFPYAYRAYAIRLVSRGVSTEYRKGAPCTQASKDPCIKLTDPKIR